MNQIKKALLVFIILTLPFSALAFAPDIEEMELPVQVKSIKQKTEQIKVNVQERVNRLQSIGQEENVEQIREKIEEHKSEILEKSKEIKGEVSGKIDNLKEREESGFRVPEMVRERMSQLVQERAGNLAQRVNSMNLRFSEGYFQMLDRTEQLIDRLEERTQRLEELLDIDLTNVYLKLTEAREQVDAARKAISAQLEEEYEVAAESIQELGNAFRGTMTRMQDNRGELRNSFIAPIRQTIKDAHLLLREAIMEHKSSLEDGDGNEE